MLWVDVVNRSLEWETGHGLEALGRAFAPRGIDGVVLGRATATLRVAAEALVLDPRASLPAPASQWLASVTLRAAVTEERGGFLLPAIRAARQRSDLTHDLEELLSTALVQLAAGGWQAVARCAGVTRRSGAALGDPAAVAFARRAGLDGILDAETAQCPRLVAGPRAGQYCSKACSNAAFALRKAAREPAYFARKQARYRAGKRRAAARVESAFAFVD